MDSGKPSSDAPLIEKIDFFFGAPENTSAIGAFLQAESNMFAQFERTDDPNGLENFALFKRYGLLVESIMERFCAAEQISMEDVGAEIHRQLVLSDELASPYICVGYIAGALDIEAFQDLVVDINAITNYDVGDAGVEPEERQDEDEQEHQQE